MWSFRSSRERRTEGAYNILLLGPRESGKSTIMKRMCITYQGGFCHDARMLYREAIYSNLLESAQAVAAALRKFGVEPTDPSNLLMLESLLEHGTQLESLICPSPFTFSSQIAEAIHSLWQDQTVPEFVDNYRSKFYLMDNAPYFFTEVRRITSADYTPTEMDILQCRQPNTGVVETRVTIPPLLIHLSEVSCQLNQPMEWMHCLERTTTVIFCVALSDYDLISTEDEGQNRLSVSLALFDAMINSQWCLRTSLILLLNKIDIFRRKLPKVPLEQYFQEYTGGPNINKATKYILWQFMQKNRAKLSVYPHIAQATDDANSVTRLISTAIANTIVKNLLEDTAIL